MLKALAIGFFLVTSTIALPGCSLFQSTQERAPNVTQAQADLHVAEGNFSKAQTVIIGLARSGILKGQTLTAVKKAEATAYAAILAARGAVDANRSDALSLVSTALKFVLELVALYAGK